MTGMRR
jgi:hypothetical protein